MSDSEKISEIEKMIIFKKSTLTGAFFFLTCLISENWFLIFINQIGTPTGFPFCDPEGPRRAGPFLPQADPRKESRLVRASQIIAPLGGWGCGIQAPAKVTPVGPTYDRRE